jgi:hypothetical protein
VRVGEPGQGFVDDRHVQPKGRRECSRPRSTAAAE